MGKFSEYIRETLSLNEHLDLGNAESTIRQNINFKGPNVIILACAIVIASVGLNVNSVPVIIGAMLISPVMGPIMGFGLSLGINDTDLMKASVKNFCVMVSISIIASSVFFLISPLNLEHPTELLSRTNPTIYDVLIAIFGGIAGMLENSRRERGTVISGVAIATALMPPLCTVGFGIATLDPHYIVGALYLFLINSVFIALAVFVTSKYLGFHPVRNEDESMYARRARVAWVVVALMVIPSIWSAVTVIRENNFTINAERFVDNNKSLGTSYVYDHKVSTSRKCYQVEVFLAGEHMNPQSRELLLRSAESHGLQRSQVILREEAAVKGTDQTEVVRDLYEYYDKRIQELNQTITDLQVELSRYKKAPADTAVAAGHADTSSSASPEASARPE